MLLKPHHWTRSLGGFRGTWRELTALRDSAGQMRALGEGVPGWVSDSGKGDFGKRGLAVGVGNAHRMRIDPTGVQISRGIHASNLSTDVIGNQEAATVMREAPWRVVTTPPAKAGGFCANAEPNGLR